MCYLTNLIAKVNNRASAADAAPARKLPTRQARAFVLGRRNENVTINCNGQRVSSYALTQINSSSSTAILAKYDTINKTYVWVANPAWPSGEIPVDSPKCGYDNSLCPCKCLITQAHHMLISVLL